MTLFWKDRTIDRLKFKHRHATARWPGGSLWWEHVGMVGFFFVADLEVISKIYHHFNTDIFLKQYSVYFCVILMKSRAGVWQTPMTLGLTNPIWSVSTCFERFLEPLASAMDGLVLDISQSLARAEATAWATWDHQTLWKWWNCTTAQHHGISVGTDASSRRPWSTGNLSKLSGNDGHGDSLSISEMPNWQSLVAVPTLLHLQCTKEMLGLHQTPNETTDSRRLYKVRTHGPSMDHPWTIWLWKSVSLGLSFADFGVFGRQGLDICVHVSWTQHDATVQRWGGYRDIQKSHWLVPKTWGPIADPIAAQVASGCCCAWHGLRPLFRWCPLGLCRGGHPVDRWWCQSHRKELCRI